MTKTIIRQFLQIGAIASLSILTATHIVRSAEQKSNSDYALKNITQSKDRQEINPSIIKDGRFILYLMFTGNPNSPMPWDYRLEKIDQEGRTSSLTSAGVIDYNVSKDNQRVILLRSSGQPEKQTLAECSMFGYENLKNWELWQMDIETGAEQLITTANDLPLSEGYKLLGRNNRLSMGRFLSESPEKTNKILVKHRFHGDYGFLAFQHFQNDGSKKVIFQSETWKSYAHLTWLPTIAWLDESTFVTLSFQSHVDPKFPQNNGIFSLVKINLESGAIDLLHKDRRIHPFPKLVLAPSGYELFFRKFEEDKNTTQLWRYNLMSGNVELVYSVEGDLGEPRFSQDGLSIVFTQLKNDNFDIIRLDLTKYNVERIASR